MNGFSLFYTLGVIVMLVDMRLGWSDQYKQFFPLLNIACIIMALTCAFVTHVGSP